ncbi:MAG: hypothetical protein AAF481_05305 [Acidobacteriota bacterium]
MTLGFRLVTLECPNCGEALAGEAEDVIFYCVACRSGFRIENDTLLPVTVHFAALRHQAAEGWLPFWTLPVRVDIRQRDASGGFLRSLMGGGDGDSVSRLVVPAFRLPVERAVEAVLRLSRDLDAADERLGEHLVGGNVDVDDARTLARYCLHAAEARKADMLKNIDLVVEFGSAGLVGVPYRTAGGRRVDALLGVPL